MITWFLEKISVATIYIHEKSLLNEAHVGFKLLISILTLLAIIFTKSFISTFILLTYPVIITLLSKKIKLLYESLLAVILPVMLLMILTWVFSPEGPLSYVSIERAIGLGFRILALALILLIMVSTTNPIAIAMFLEKYGLPIFFSQSLILTWRLIPLVLRDLVESITSLRLKGFPRWKILIPLTSVSVERAYKVSEALYIKGFGWYKRRTYIRSFGKLSYGLLIFLIFLAVFSTSLILEFLIG